MPGRLDSVYRLDPLVVDFPAVADYSHPQHFLLSVGLVNDPVITNAQLEQTREGSGEGLGFNGVKILGEPAEPFQHTVSDNLVELCKVLGRFGTKLDLIHLPIQTPTASQFGRRNILALLLRLLKIPPKAFPDLGPQSETRIGVVKNLAQFLLHHFADDRP